jgi:predicted DNA-binding transcriptional regulator AlpA
MLQNSFPTPANDNLPLFLGRQQSAHLCGLSPSTFDTWVKQGILPSPLPGTRRWSRFQLEQAAKRETTERSNSKSPFEEWKQSRRVH